MDERLRCIEEMAGRGAGVADIGSDHALLICALVESGAASFGLACDVAPGPLSHSHEEIQRRGLDARVTPILSDGLAEVPRAGLDRIVIAGMGGELIARILGDCPFADDPSLTWLLQPMTRPEHLRAWLCQAGFSIAEERCCAAAGHLYSVLRVRWTGVPTAPDARLLWFGRTDPARDPLAGEYQKRVLRRLTRQLSGLRAAHAPDPEQITGLQQLLCALRPAEKTED